MDKNLWRAARRDVARRRVMLAQELGVEYAESLDDQRVLAGHGRSQARLDMEWLRPSRAGNRSA